MALPPSYAQLAGVVDQQRQQMPGGISVMGCLGGICIKGKERHAIDGFQCSSGDLRSGDFVVFLVDAEEVTGGLQELWSAHCAAGGSGASHQIPYVAQVEDFRLSQIGAPAEHFIAGHGVRPGVDCHGAEGAMENSWYFSNEWEWINVSKIIGRINFRVERFRKPGLEPPLLGPMQDHGEQDHA
jgi:hypothetical protein